MATQSDNMIPHSVHCPKCGYDLRALPEHRCPECGFHYDKEGIVGLNVAWAMEVLDDLRFAVLVQAVASGSIIVYAILPLRRGAGIPCAEFCVAPFVTLFLVALLFWSVNAITLAEVRSRVSQATRRVAWLCAILVLLGFAARYEADVPFVWMLFPIPGLVMGGLAMQKARMGHELNRDEDPRIRRRLKPWIRCNLCLVAVSAMTALAAGIMALF